MNGRSLERERGAHWREKRGELVGEEKRIGEDCVLGIIGGGLSKNGLFIFLYVVSLESQQSMWVHIEFPIDETSLTINKVVVGDT